VATRWRQGGDDAAWLRLAFALQVCLRGSPCIYQGDELGLTEVEIAFEDLQDPYGIAMWPQYRGRDGCRTPMVWDAAAPQGGFSTAAHTWLPVAPEHLPLAALRQTGDPESMFSFYRGMLAWRHGHEALRLGSTTLLPAHDSVLAFIRDPQGAHGRPLLCAFNLGAQPARYELPAGTQVAAQLQGPELPAGALDGSAVTLPAYGALFAAL
jgi:alpha-glucosidase